MPTKFVKTLFHVGDATEPFEISNEVKQGCVLAPVLFNIFFTCIMAHAVQDQETGVYIRFRLDGCLFDLRRLTDKTKSSLTLSRKPSLPMTVRL